MTEKSHETQSYRRSSSSVLHAGGEQLEHRQPNSDRNNNNLRSSELIQSYYSPSSQPSAQPSMNPSETPSSQPSMLPTTQPSSLPSNQPSLQPSSKPLSFPSAQPSAFPSNQPSVQPSMQPSHQPSSKPSVQPSKQPSIQPTMQPSIDPTSQPSQYPSAPSSSPSSQPSMQPSRQPSSQPSFQPSMHPSFPSRPPTSMPSCQPSVQPSSFPTLPPISWQGQNLTNLTAPYIDNFNCPDRYGSTGGVYVDKNGSIFSTSYSNGFGLSLTRIWYPNGTYQGTYRTYYGGYTSYLDGDTNGALYITDNSGWPHTVTKAHCPQSPGGPTSPSQYCRGPVTWPSGLTGSFRLRVFNEVLYVTDYPNHRILTKSLTSGTEATIAGTYGVCGDVSDVPATSAQLCNPYVMWISTIGDVYFADLGSSRVKKITATTGILSAYAGNGSLTYGGENRPALVTPFAGLDARLVI